MAAIDLNDVRGEVEILLWVKRREAELKELKDKARAAVEAKMGDASAGMLDGELVVNWGTHKRKSFDEKAFREAHPALHEEFKVVKPVRRFEIIDNAGDDDDPDS